MGARMESGLSGVQQKVMYVYCVHTTLITLPQVLNCISGSMVAQGMHIQDVIQTVSRQGCSEAQIRLVVIVTCAQLIQCTSGKQWNSCAMRDMYTQQLTTIITSLQTHEIIWWCIRWYKKVTVIVLRLDLVFLVVGVFQGQKYC